MSGIDVCDLSVLSEEDMLIAIDRTEAMARTPPVRNIDEIVLSLTAEIRRLRAENAELKAAMGSGDDIMIDVICKCGASGLRPEKLLSIAFCTVCGRKMRKAA